MHIFLTSSPCPFGEDGHMDAHLDNSCGFVDKLAAVWPAYARVLIVAADPGNRQATQGQAETLRKAFQAAELECLPFSILDDSTAGEAKDLLNSADVVILAGGHVPTQNAFLTRIALAELLQAWDGIVIGISAGTMNSASTVYAMPELEGEAKDPTFKRFLKGLGLTQTMVVPHCQSLEGLELDGQLMIDDIAATDSQGRELLLLPDGSFLDIGEDGLERLCGPAWLMKDGKMRPMQRHMCLIDDAQEIDA